MDAGELAQSQALPLGMKIIKSQQRIREWHDHWRGQVYISFSGGKDSTVLLRLAREIYPDIPAVFCDTGMEYPEVREFARSMPGVETVRPEMNFREVIEKYGYPVVSKMVAQKIMQYRAAKSESFKNKLLNGWVLEDGTVSKRFSIPNRWRFLIGSPFKISDECCGLMKKKPFKEYAKKTRSAVITGEMAADSETRLRHYLKSGCNAFDYKRPKSTPLGFWTDQDILEYLRQFSLPYASVYGDIIEHNGRLITTGDERTGCMFCMFGIHLDRGENRFMRMRRTHPKLWDYCIHKLGCGRVLNYIGIPYSGLFSEADEFDKAE
jgi:3'-phosphoadenosine 5'-phosphosulfate sulfotransferase (PAPS reductase)/FAD synthetase